MPVKFVFCQSNDSDVGKYRHIIITRGGGQFKTKATKIIILCLKKKQ